MRIEERVTEYTDENGIKHKFTQMMQVNEDGTEVERATIDEKINETIEPAKEPLSEIEQSMLETAVNVDYLVCLADLGI